MPRGEKLNQGYNRRKEELNTRQNHFVDFYIQSGNASESARKAGYSEKNAGAVGNELLRNPKIKRAIQSRMETLESSLIAKDKEILEYLTSIMRGEKTEEIVVNVGVGKGFTQAQKVKAEVTAKERLKAAEMLAKARGMFITKSEMEISGSIPVVIADDL